MFALEFPPINEILRWQDLFPTFNKIALIAVLSALIGIVVFLIAARQDAMAAPNVRNLAEVTVEFIEDGVVMQTMGREGLGWTPFLLSLFIFIYLCNLPGIVPFFQMPATARMAIPLFLSLIVWVTYIGVGLKHQGLAYLGHTLWPPGVPTALKPLVGFIEFVSNILVRPFSLTVRLFANMLAGHILLVTSRCSPKRSSRPRTRCSSRWGSCRLRCWSSSSPSRCSSASCRPTSSRSSLRVYISSSFQGEH